MIGQIVLSVWFSGQYGVCEEMGYIYINIAFITEFIINPWRTEQEAILPRMNTQCSSSAVALQMLNLLNVTSNVVFLMHISSVLDLL